MRDNVGGASLCASGPPTCFAVGSHDRGFACARCWWASRWFACFCRRCPLRLANTSSERLECGAWLSDWAARSTPAVGPMNRPPGRIGSPACSATSSRAESQWHVNLAGSSVGVEELRKLRGCDWILRLDLSSTNIGDDGIEPCRHARRSHGAAAAEDARHRLGLLKLKPLGQLMILDVAGTAATYRRWQSWNRR